MDNPIKVRIAPSPTGIPHIGNTRTAFFNYLFAKHNKGEFLLRIDDTDRVRYVPQSEKAIFEILKWLGINWDGEPYVQSQHLNNYKKHLALLQEKGLVYEDNGAYRFKMEKAGKIAWNDAVGNKTVTFNNDTQEDFVIIKSDGYPTYNFATVIDDNLMKITHIIRGEEFISSTPKQIQLYKAFGWDMPVFAHLPVILGNDRAKLSKRHGAKSALDYRDEGYLPEALLNYMALLGWNPGGDKEIMSMDEMIQLFDLKDIHTANPVFDAKKLEWMNGEYIRKYQISNIKYQISNLEPKLKNINEEIVEKLIPLAQTRAKTLREIVLLILTVTETATPSANEKKEIKEKIKNDLNAIGDWNKDAIAEVLIQKYVYGKIVSLKEIYLMLFGVDKGLPLADTFAILGKEKTLAIFQV